MVCPNSVKGSQYRNCFPVAVWHQQDKFIAAQPRQRHGVIKAAVYALCAGDKQLIANVMAPGVVYDFESIKVDKDQGEVLLMQFGMTQAGL